MNKKLADALMFLILIFLTGCSSLQPKTLADSNFTAFLNQPRKYALYTPVTIESEKKLSLFGVPDYGARVSQRFDIQSPILNVINQVVESTPSLSHTIIVPPDKVNELPLLKDDSVLFFHSDWNFVYRRLPPDFSLNQLQVGVVAKIIPFGQVLAGQGPMALQTASWEAKCFYKVFSGEYLSSDEWESDNGRLLHQGLREAQQYCAENLISEFSKRLSDL